ncbi:MAG: aromatic ring-hydroxylating dioxygenase subunit alpha [Acidobacteria bacterium]|nr:aromatic ring-hydroxylating dioxygenase subunit alpha [Acidobacteriota bacterium]
MMSMPATTLPARYYNDPEIFRREAERFFCRMWISIGRSEEIRAEGEFVLCEIAGESIIVTRTGQRVQGLYNVCRHRGTRLCRQDAGKFSGSIRCPYHGWTYALDGRLVGAPHMEEANFRRELYPLHRVQAEEWEGHIFLNLAAASQPLSTYLGDLPQKLSAWGMHELRRYKQISYQVRANWKLIVLNYNECLHCPFLHPSLNRITDYLSGINQAPQPSYIGGSMEFRDGAETMNREGRRRRDYLPGLSQEQRRQVFYYAVYPNLLLSLHPDYVMAHRLWPEGVDLTRVVCEWYFHPEEMAKPNFHADDAVEFWDTTNREDWAICELAQKGISSRAYVPGPYSRREGLLSAFDRWIVEQERASDRDS